MLLVASGLSYFCARTPWRRLRRRWLPGMLLLGFGAGIAFNPC